MNDLRSASPAGPYRTEREARETPAARAVYEAVRADPGVGKMTPHNLKLMLDAVGAARVQVGAYDVRILEWLANYEPEIAVVIAGLITRAAS
jgi:hypothetical protein